MRLVATVVGGGLLAILTLGLARVLLGGLLGIGMFVLALVFKLAFAALMIFLAIKLLKKLVPPAKEA